MITIRQGGKVYGPGVFMFEGEAAQVKAALLAYGTKAAKRLAVEIGMPSDGIAYPNGVVHGVRDTAEARHAFGEAENDDRTKLAELRKAMKCVATRLSVFNRDGLNDAQKRWLGHTLDIAAAAMDADGTKAND